MQCPHQSSLCAVNLLTPQQLVLLQLVLQADQCMLVHDPVLTCPDVDAVPCS